MESVALLFAVDISSNTLPVWTINMAKLTWFSDCCHEEVDSSFLFDATTKNKSPEQFKRKHDSLFDFETIDVFAYLIVDG